MPWTSTYWFASMRGHIGPVRADHEARGRGGSGLFRAGGSHPLGLAPLLGEVGRPGSVPEPALLVAARKVQELLERAGVLVDLGRRVALLPEPIRDRVEAQVGGFHVGDLAPLD